MARVDLKIVAGVSPPPTTATTASNLKLGATTSNSPTPGFLRLTCGAPFEVAYRFNYSTAVPTGDWLGVIAWGDEPTAGTCIVRRPFLESSSGTVFFEEGPPLPGKYAVHAFLTESNNAVAGSTAMFECISGFGAEEARCSRNGREFTLYLSTRWDMMLERAAFRDAAAPALKQMLDARGVTFGFIDARSDLDVEDLTTPRGVDAVLDGIRRCCPYFVCCLGELNDVELGAESVNASILQGNPWLKRVLLSDSPALTNSSDREKKLVRAGRMRAAAAMLTVTDLEVLSGFLLPVLQETIQAESGSCTTAGVTRARLAAVPGGAARHSCIVNALADFRRLVSQQDREGGDGHDEEVAGDGNGKPVAADAGHGCSEARIHDGTRLLLHSCRVPSQRAPPYPKNDLSRAIDRLYPMHTAPDRLDYVSLFPHASARNLLNAAVVKLPVVRYRGFRPEPSAVTGGVLASPGLAVSPAASTAVTAATAAAAAAAAASAAWRLQQRLEFIPFEERVKRMSGEAQGGGDISSAAAAHAAAADGGTAAAVRVDLSLGSDGRRGTARSLGTTPAETGSEGTRDGAAGSGAAPASTPAVAAKRLAVVLADYLGDKTTIGMVVVDQPGTGLTTALLGFLEWYCRGQVAGGRKGVTVVESLDRIPQYGRCNLSRAVISRPRLVSRNLNDGGLADETVERRTLVVRVDCRDPCHGRLDKAHLVNYLSCEIIRTFGMPYKMPDKPGLSSRYRIYNCRLDMFIFNLYGTYQWRRGDATNVGTLELRCRALWVERAAVRERTHWKELKPLALGNGGHHEGKKVHGIVSEQTSDNPREHNHDDDEAAVDPQDQLAADTAAPSGTKSGGGTMAVAAATSGGKGGKEGGRTEIGPEVLRRWFDVLRGHGDLVLVIENPDALVTPEERAAASPEQVPNPLAWLPPELPPHVKVITTCSTGSSCQQLLCGAEGWGWHMLRRKAGLDADTKGQVIDAVLRKHGVGCMLDWVESDLVLKEKTANIQFLVGVTEALCYSGKLARSGLPPGLHTAASAGSRPASPSSVSSAAACRSNSGSCTSAGKGENCDGGGGGGGGLSDADVASLRGAAASMMHEESAIGVARLRIRQLVSIKGHRGSLLRAALCLVRLSHAGLSVLELSAALRHILERYKSQRHQHHKPPPYTNVTASAAGSGTGGRNTGSSNKGPGNSSNVHDNTSNNGNNSNSSNSNPSSSQTTTTASAREPPAREAAVATPTTRQSPASTSPQATGSPETPPNPGASADTTKDRNNDSGLPDAPRKSVTTTDTTATTATKKNTTTSEEVGDASMAHASSTEVGGGGKPGAATAPTAAAKQPPERGGKGAAALGEHGLTSSSPRAERTQRPAFGQQDWRALEPDLMQFCHKVLGRFVLRDFVTVTAVDLECLETRDKFVVLADSFAKDLPGVRRAEEQLAALAAIVVLSTHGGVEAPRRASRPHREKLFTALADVELLYAMNGSKSTFEEYYNVVSHKAMGFHGRNHREHYQHQARAAATHDLLYTVHGLKHPVAARQPGGGGGSGGGKPVGGGLSELCKVLAARRRQKQPPPPPLTRAGALRLLEAAKLVLERLGDAEETMNLAESAWALMFG
ncbi:hypothetical protein Esi_0041_0099 [Ectocarpus siliculosus]|uniref:Uncharacterized protein n=1 Tax=Ectocarpus siliculosus TaxID=2880 RepID=D8LMV8_ECTSI|nr:hypothetical protein Esi_0041_0099 [Ectocarpus siliculosus]|eukprot:CBN74759.1 hypothetical protein Esi_0041_0099 [Ectocarpus siliculosus]